MKQSIDTGIYVNHPPSQLHRTWFGFRLWVPWKNISCCPCRWCLDPILDVHWWCVSSCGWLCFGCQTCIIWLHQSKLVFWMYSTAWRYISVCILLPMYLWDVPSWRSAWQLYPASTFAMASFPNNLRKVHINHYYYSIYAHIARSIVKQHETSGFFFRCDTLDDIATFFFWGRVTWGIC